ncbi:MAG: PTS sugar transporter subunit IIA [Calditrichaeota bacterium]|nr:PTS sugar transporter subunit IIA [Calditrichota bacterium]
MHNIKKWLKSENIHLHLSAESELEAIWTMLDLAALNPAVVDTKVLARSIYDNEMVRSSHRGCSGVTFYSLTNAVSRPLMILGRFEKGIGYFSIEKRPIDLVALLAAPEKHESELESMIICIKDILCDSKFMDNIRVENNSDKIYRHFLRHCASISLHENTNNDLY